MSTDFWFTVTRNLWTNQGVADWATNGPTPEKTQITEKFLSSVENISKEIFQGGILSITGRFSEDLPKKFSEHKPENQQTFFQFLKENGLEGRYFCRGELSQSLGDIFVRTEMIYQAINRADRKEEETDLKFLLKQEQGNIQRALLSLKTNRTLERLRVARDLYENRMLNPERIKEVKEAKQLGWEATIIWERNKGNYAECPFLAPPFPFERAALQRHHEKLSLEEESPLKKRARLQQKFFEETLPQLGSKVANGKPHSSRDGEFFLREACNGTR